MGTSYYQAPEAMMREQYNEKVDAWAVGIVILEIWMKCRVDMFEEGCFPAIVPSFPREEQLSAIKHPQLFEITKKLLVKDVSKRMSIIDIYKKNLKPKPKPNIYEL